MRDMSDIFCPFSFAGFGVHPPAISTALLKRSIHVYTFGYISEETRVGGYSPFNPRIPSNVQTDRLMALLVFTSSNEPKPDL